MGATRHGGEETLTAGDAARVEAAFHSKLSTLEAEPDTGRDNAADAVLESAQQHSSLNARPRHRLLIQLVVPLAIFLRSNASGAIDKGTRIPEPRRIRDEEHLKFE